MPFDERERPDLDPTGVDHWIETPELCEGCPDCDALAREMILGFERDLRTLSLDLWVAGWTPTELIAEVRRVTGSTDAASFVALVLIVDDSHRSEHARPESWCREIDSLRAVTGTAHDDSAGWLGRWTRSFSAAERPAACLQLTMRVLGDLVDPRIDA